MQPMMYPASLQPTATETLTLPSRRSVSFPKTTPTFPIWRGDPVEDNYGGKDILDFDSRPAFAEFLWTLENDGWQGVWVDTFHRAFRTDYWNCLPQSSLPQKPSSLSEEIWNLANTPTGVWDVFCWQGDRVLFCEAKKAGKDKIRLSQLSCAESALNTGVPLDSFLLVEWKTA